MMAASFRVLLVLVAARAWAWQAVGAVGAAADWPMYNRDYASSRYSPLAEITPKNVAGLRQVCSYTLPEAATLESGLVALAGTLYFTTSEYTYAMDSETCALRWRSQHKVEGPGGTVRGVAIAGNRVFRVFRDGYVVGYNLADGERVWATQLREPDGRFATIALAPIAWSGMLFIGTSGAERACRCDVVALDTATGRETWRFQLVPTGNDAGAETWPRGIRVGGASVWTSLTLDTGAGALYVPAGNPGPDFAGEYRPGANLYTNSIVVLDAKSGKLRTWYQLVPHDVHDWDVAAAPALVTTKLGRRRAMAPGKDGYLHAIDIAMGKVIWKTAVTTIENSNTPITTSGTHFCPGAEGGVLWNGPGYSPQTNLVYVNSVDWCTTLRMDTKLPVFEPDKSFLGSANGFGVKDTRKVGWLVAVDADSGGVRWRFASATPMVAGVTPTASGLVLTADLGGDLLVFDAADGRVLRRIALGQPTGGGVITYQNGGKQRIAVATGLEDRILDVHGKPAVVIWGL
jgi:alcohol dehydrogenase (cytochrome c)